MVFTLNKSRTDQTNNNYDQCHQGDINIVLVTRVVRQTCPVSMVGHYNYDKRNLVSRQVWIVISLTYQ